jgi:hypothetical protein
MVTGKALKKMILATGMPLKKFSEAADLSPSKTLDWWCGGSKILGRHHIVNLREYFGLTEEQCRDGQFDIKLLRKRIYGDRMSLPDLYEESAYSYVRSSGHILEYLKLLYGQHYVDKLLMSMNIHPCYFDDPTRKINILFFMDLLKHCSNIGFGREEFRRLASSLFLMVEGTQIASKFPRARSFEEAYCTIDEGTYLFETNFDYKFNIASSGFELTAVPKDEIAELIEKSGKDVAPLYLYRSLIFGAMPILCSLPGLSLQVQSCISRGDDVSRYTGQFPRVFQTAFR